MGPRSTLPLLPHPQFGPVSPLSAVFPALLSYLWEEEGGWGLPSDIGDIFLSNIWRNECYFADLIMHIYPYLPGEHF